MDEIRATQLAIETLLGAGCVVGYRVETARAASMPLKGQIERLRIAGQGEWIVLGMSEEASFESVSAVPELVSEGFELEGDRGRVAVPKGAKVRIVQLDGARRAPLDAITRDGVVRPRFTFELKPGAEVWLDVMLPVLHAYRAAEPEQPDRPVILGGSAASVQQRADAGAFPGCWIMILCSTLVVAVFGTLGSWPGVGWAGIAFTAALMFFGWVAMPAKA